jgi:signal transduction histidine kinase
MNVYTQKQYWKLILLLFAIIIGIASLWYTNRLVERLAVEERKKVELWAEATKQLANAENGTELSFVLKVIVDNKTVPVILSDKDDNVISFVNLDSAKAKNQSYLAEQLSLMKSENERIEVSVNDDYKQYIYFRNSTLLLQLKYFPYIQLAVISLFILVSYFAFSSSRKAEQNQVWMGLAKETAHQLGTPLSSLLAWTEVLKTTSVDKELLLEFGKDVNRLEIITERFSKIGSTPNLVSQNLSQIVEESIGYIQSRVSSKVSFGRDFKEVSDLAIPLNKPLFEWVVENLCKNAVDAMSGIGEIEVVISDQTQFVYVDITDTGKGVAKNKYKTIFEPGFTTKKRGWGLGLSLCKRIIENYHNGKVFVKSSALGVGTTFRIVLNK